MLRQTMFILTVQSMTVPSRRYAWQPHCQYAGRDFCAQRFNGCRFAPPQGRRFTSVSRAERTSLRAGQSERHPFSPHLSLLGLRHRSCQNEGSEAYSAPHTFKGVWPGVHQGSTVWVLEAWEGAWVRGFRLWLPRMASVSYTHLTLPTKA